jgi:hypothetical protein
MLSAQFPPTAPMGVTAPGTGAIATLQARHCAAATPGPGLRLALARA